MIARPPIFMHMSDKDAEFLKLRTDVMNEYWCNQKQFTEEYLDVTKLNDDVLSNNPYATLKNPDNYPTHRMVDEKTGEEKFYHEATKNFKYVDPTCDDRKSLHYAGEDRTYLIFKNKFSKEWEFPTGRVFFG